MVHLTSLWWDFTNIVVAAAPDAQHSITSLKKQKNKTDTVLNCEHQGQHLCGSIKLTLCNFLTAAPETDRLYHTQLFRGDKCETEWRINTEQVVLAQPFYSYLILWMAASLCQSTLKCLRSCTRWRTKLVLMSMMTRGETLIVWSDMDASSSTTSRPKVLLLQ